MLGISLRCLQYKLKAYQKDGLESVSQFNRTGREPAPVRSVNR